MDANLLSQTYDRDLSDVLKMQDEIAIALVRALQIEVSREGLISRPALHNTEAYTLYLQGLHAFDRIDQQGFEQAASYFQQALDLDPSFAAAANMLSGCSFRSWTVRIHASSRRFREGSSCRTTRVGTGSEFGRSACPSGGGVSRRPIEDWQAADREIRLARALAPRDPDVLFISAVQAKTWVVGTMR